MRGNDIDNALPPRVAVVWEGVLARPAARPRRGLRRNPPPAVGEPDPDVTAALSRLWRLTAVRLDVFTFLGEDAEPHITRSLERIWLPHHVVRSWPDRAELVASLPQQFDLIAVYDTPEYVLMYGGLGQTIDQLGRLA